jgi:hypothetical protein
MNHVLQLRQRVAASVVRPCRFVLDGFVSRASLATLVSLTIVDSRGSATRG